MLIGRLLLESSLFLELVFRVGIFQKQTRFRNDASADSIVEASMESVLEAV